MFVRVLVTVAAAMAVNILLQLPTSAQEFNWATDEITVERRSDLSTSATDYGLNIGDCTIQPVLLPNSWGYYGSYEYCTFQAKSFKYTLYDGKLFINLSGSNIMYPVVDRGFGTSLHFITPVPNSDDLIFAASYLKDVPHHVQSNNNAYNPAYNELPGFLYPMSMDDQGVSHNVIHLAVSNNGRWVVMSITDLGYVRLDTSNMAVKWVAPHTNANEFVSISNDGNTIASAAWAYDPIKVYNLEDCGEAAIKLQSSWFTSTNSSPCEPRDFSPIINTALGSGTYTSPTKPMFSDDDTELTLFVRPNGMGGEGIVLKVANNTAPASHLDYLALGDSYSSGEGDLGINSDGWPYYTYLSRGVGGCHLSTRSYPFLLAQFKAVPRERMQSVACSGARLATDYFGSSENYLGQRNQLTDMSAEERTAQRSNALSNFNPGILKQLDFVRQNKPKVVTITGGGNDVEFAKLMTYCAVPSSGGERSNTCDQAVENTVQRSMLADSIRAQYDKIIELITAVKEASESTTIYMVGYPSFTSETNSFCLNSGSLNQAERTMINASITYMNKVISDASKASGARYVDIEASLHGGRICEGSEYVTGVLGDINLGFTNHKVEMFHPNSEGHIKMATAISDSGFAIESGGNPIAADGQAPAKPAFFGTGAHVPTMQGKLLRDGVISVGEIAKFSITPGLYAAHQSVNFTIHSKEKKLGSYETDQNGEVNEMIRVPHSIKPGYHMVVAEGEASGGGMLRLYQYVEVRSSTGNDRDGDGVKDNKDKCQYIEHWYDETTKKDVCATK